MKFDYTTDFQFDVLKYTVTNSSGYKALELYNDSYFTLIEHAVIAYTLKRYYKKAKKIPGKTMLIEELHNTFDHRDFTNNLTDEDRDEILRIAKALFRGDLKDSDQLIKSVEKFAQYVDLKNTVEKVDLLDYSQYDTFSRKIQKAISPRIKVLEERGNFLFKDIRDRQIRRKENPSIVPLPYRGLNRLTNAGGYSKGSILVILDRAKKFKTGALVNLASNYLKIGKRNVLVIDLDNGEDDWTIRLEQSMTSHTKLELLSDDIALEERIRKSFRHKKRVNGEIVVKRMPSLVTTANDIDVYMEFLYNEFGFEAEILIIDYIAKMGCISGKDSLHERISEAYIDIDNLGLKRNLHHIWTAQHVTREAAKVREKTCYESTDIAGAIDVSRHVQAIFGLNRSAKDEQKGIQRVEVVDQRDGVSHGRAIFFVDYEKQTMIEFDKKEYKEYYEDNVIEEEDDTSYNGNKKSRKNDAD